LKKRPTTKSFVHFLRKKERKMADTKEDKGSASTSEHLNIKVKQDDSEIVFKIKRSTPLKKLMNAYCQRQSLEISQIVFLYEGSRIQMEDTPEALGIEDGDEIDAMIHQIGGV
jgi:small ubiquitin-related modifier